MVDLSDLAPEFGRRKGGGGPRRTYRPPASPPPPQRTPFRPVGGYQPAPEPEVLGPSRPRFQPLPEEAPAERTPRPFGARSKEGARSSADFTRAGGFRQFNNTPVDRDSPRAQVRDPLLSGSPWADQVNAGLGEGITPEFQARLQALRQAMINSARSGA